MKYSWDDGTQILELIKSLNHYGEGTVEDRVDYAFRQYDYFKAKIKEANSNV